MSKGWLEDQKVLVTGPTIKVEFPVVRALAQRNEVHGLARFRNSADRERVEALGVRCISADLAEDGLDELADDYDAVLHFAVVKSGDFAYDLRANAEGAGRLMAHCRRAGAFLHCSSAAVYAHAGGKPVTEDAPLGDNHRLLLPTYSLSKIAAEEVVRFAARQWSLPTVIARLSVPYGDNGGWPWIHLLLMQAGRSIAVHSQGPNLYNPIHEDDILAHLPRLLAIAAVPAIVVNWGGSEPVALEAWCAHIAELTGLGLDLTRSEEALGALPIDVTRMTELLGPTRVSWREGIRRMIEARAPELLAGR